LGKGEGLTIRRREGDGHRKKKEAVWTVPGHKLGSTVSPPQKKIKTIERGVSGLEGRTSG